MKKQITAILLGAGNRGEKSYASYALNYPNELTFTGVAEPRKDRRDAFVKDHQIQEENAVVNCGERPVVQQIGRASLT